MNATTKRVGALAGGASLLLVVIWYLALFHPESHHLSAAHQARAAAEQQVSQLTGQVAQLKVLETQIPSDQAQLAKLETALPDNPDLPDALGQLNAAAIASGVQLTSVSPSAPASASSPGSQPQSGPPSITLTMSASGSYQQLMGFMSRLATMPRTVVVNTTSLSAGGSGNALSANLTAQIFYADTAAP